MGNVRADDMNFKKGVALLEGDGVEKNTDEGLALIISAAENGHIAAINKLHSIAVMYSENGEREMAYSLYERMYKIKCGLYGEDSANAILYLDTWACMCKADYLRTKILKRRNSTSLTDEEIDELGRCAQRLEIKTYDFRLKVLGEKHRDTMKSIDKMAKTATSLGEYKKAMELYQRLYALRVDVLGENDDAAIETLDSIGVVYRWLGDYNTAEEFYALLYERKRKLYGERDERVIDTLQAWAQVCRITADFNAAIEIYKRLLKAQGEVLGMAHDKTLATINTLVFLHERIDDYESALYIFEEWYALMDKSGKFTDIKRKEADDRRARIRSRID